MDEYWATRTGRWRRAMHGRSGPSFADRLFDVIVSDIFAHALPAGALLPTVERVARELVIPEGDVRSAYERLLAERVIAERADGMLCIPAPDGGEATVGDATQVRFEGALLRAVRKAAARGLGSTGTTGVFDAAILRTEAESRPSDEPEDAR